MHAPILFIDDDVHFLSSCKRSLGNEFSICTAQGADEGLRLLKEQGPVSVVISDLRMPGMDGIELLRRVRQIAPETVRILLTGHADQQTAIDAANTGKVFRFLTKPCDRATLNMVLREAVRQYHTAVAERELLEQTLVGVVGVLTQILSLINPVAQGKANRLKQYCLHMARESDYQEIWLVEMAAMLSQLGCLTIPPEILTKQGQEEHLKPEERVLLQKHPEMAVKLLMRIPRFEDVVEIIAHQNKPVPAWPSYADPQRNERIATGTRILQTAMAIDALILAGLPPGEALDALAHDPAHDPHLVGACRSYDFGLQNMVRMHLSCEELNTHMIADEDIFTLQDHQVATRGERITPPLLAALLNYSRTVGIREPVAVLLPLVQFNP